MRRSLFVLVSMLSFGCGTEAAVPEKPTWVDDVAPILRANCFQCHGSTARWMPNKTRRWDVFDLSDPRYAALGFNEDPVMFVSAKSIVHFASILGFIESTDPTQIMPPPPALPLSARDIEVLKKWADGGFEPGSHRPNLKPTISWLQKSAGQFQVVDGNQDQVLGKLDCGGTEVAITRTGGNKLPGGAAAPCTGTLFDGFDEVTVNLR